MTPQISELIERIRGIEEELELELAKKRDELRFSLENRKALFENEILRKHKQLRISLLRYVLRAKPRHILTAPIIYPMIFPLLLLDAFVFLYQLICFPVYGISKVRRRDYLVFDHQDLVYLNLLEKINCAYCSYANGLVSYVKEIVARTEQYWCPIKHARRILQAHSRYSRFTDYGDGNAYRNELKNIRCDFGSDEKEEKG